MKVVGFVIFITSFQLLKICLAGELPSSDKRTSLLRGKQYDQSELTSEDKSIPYGQKSIKGTRTLRKRDNEMNLVTDSAPFIDFTIINGLITDKNRYKYMVSLTDSAGNHICGGSLIAGDLVLTAAHCRNYFSKVQIGRYDTADSSEQYEEFDINGVVEHPEYDSKYLKYDFMIAKIKGKSSFPAVKLINKDQNIPEDLTVFGWGVTDANGFPYKGPLLQADLEYIPNSQCMDSTGFVDGIYGSYYGLIKDNMMCAYSPNSDACFGDSGGPLIAKGATDDDDMQVGVVSWGFGCNHPDFPGVYARIDNQIDWIQKVACILSPNDLPDNFKCIKRPGRDSALDASCTPKRGCEEGFTCINNKCIKDKDKNGRGRNGK